MASNTSVRHESTTDEPANTSTPSFSGCLLGKRSATTKLDEASSDTQNSSATEGSMFGPFAKTADTSSASFRFAQKSTSAELLNTWLENVELVQPVKRQRMSTKDNMKQSMIALATRYRIVDREMWRELCWEENHEVSEYNSMNLHRYRYLETVDEACKLAMFSIKPLSWRERVQQVVVPRDSLEEANKIADNFMDMMAGVGNPLQIWSAIFNVMTRGPRSGSKVRTVYMQGPASTGKSSVMQLLTSVYDIREIGRFGPQGSTSQFWLEDLVGKEVYVGDEAPANPLNIQQYLLLLEGNSALKTEIKYGGKPTLRPKPVVIASNQHIYANCQAYARAVHDRCLVLKMVNRVSPLVNVRPEPIMATYVLHCLYTR